MLSPHVKDFISAFCAEIKNSNLRRMASIRLFSNCLAALGDRVRSNQLALSVGLKAWELSFWPMFWPVSGKTCGRGLRCPLHTACQTAAST
jgi:hypothetical protein